jgi:hypothetical protein
VKKKHIRNFARVVRQREKRVTYKTDDRSRTDSLGDNNRDPDRGTHGILCKNNPQS